MDTHLIASDTLFAEQNTWKDQAEKMVFCDLINSLIHENLLGFLEKSVVSSMWVNASDRDVYTLDEGEFYFYLPVDERRKVMFRVYQQRFIQTYKISRLPVVLLTVTEDGVMQQELNPVEFMQIFAESVTEAERLASLPNLQDFLSELTDSINQTELSIRAMMELQCIRNDTDPPLLYVERFSAYRDRPFHPTSRAKRGWDNEEYRRYSPEFGNWFGLDWVAVQRNCIKASTSIDAASFVLNETERQELQLAVQQAGIESEDYCLLPVHPWQMEHVLRTLFAKEIAEKKCVPVISGLGSFRATSSVRAMSPRGDGNRHVKVPVGIYSLGALRVLPPRYLHNGQKAQALLQQVMQKDALLNNRLRLCNESNWWGYYDPDADPFEDKPGHLSCLIREYPDELLYDDDVDLIPMSALAVIDQNRQNPLFHEMLAKRFGKQTSESQVLELFGEIAHVFIETSLQCFRYGMMPEIHGQNVVLIIQSGRVNGLLLRDHDTVRLHLPWLTREGLSDPEYIVKPGTPNSLVNETPEQLLSYFQTLGVQVNLYAIMDALSSVYAIDEALFWQELKRVIHMCTADNRFPPAVCDVIKQQLLESSSWPTRLLLSPLLKRIGSGGGSMPAGVGTTANPLKSLGVADE